MGSSLRILVFRPAGIETVVDLNLRDRLVPELLTRPGICAAYAGRRGTADDRERVVATVWQDDAEGGPGSLTGASDGVTGALLEASVLERLDPEAALGADARLDVLPIAETISARRNDEPHILRIFRGETRPGELEAYVEEARSGAHADLESNEGLVALYLGVQPPSRFITVSAWTAWAPIEVATGGNIRQPMATRNAARIETGVATHYEIVAAGRT